MKTALAIFGSLLFLSCILSGIDAGLFSNYDQKVVPYHPSFGLEKIVLTAENKNVQPRKPKKCKQCIRKQKRAVVDEQELVTKYLQPDDVGRNRKYDELNHKNQYLCTRDCTKFPKARLCYYIFNVEQYGTMGPACRNCSTGNITDCHRRQCIQADGIERMAISINRMIPGPTIDVCHGDRIVVDVLNKLPTSAVSIHWHGVLQKDTPWMDGVPFVTQCPINPNTRFRYDFPADTNGTLFYHAHIPHLHSNGLYGALIVRTPQGMFDPNYKLHEFDVPSHTIHVSDWTHFPAEAFAPGYFRNTSHYPEKPDVYLINGRGSYSDVKTTTNVAQAEFHLKCGRKYRFRIIASTTSSCSFKFAIQDHTMDVVALDGYPCNPINVNTLVMSSGQRTDIIIKPNNRQSCNNAAFLIVVKGMDTCGNTTSVQTANLIYDNTSRKPTKPKNLTAIHERPPYLNNHQLNCTDPDNNVCADTLPPAQGYSGYILDEKRKVDHKFIIRPGFYNFTLDELYETNTYSPFYVPFGPLGPFAAALNNVTGILPPVPLLTQEKEIPPDIPICHGYCKNNESICRCLNILEVGLNSVVEIQFEQGIIHPIHLHGHHFTVISSNSSISRGGTIQRDVVHVPLGGLARVRFLANNPGYWIMHCHFNPHFDNGMFLIFKVGNTRSFKPPPPNFPRCGDFRSPIEKL